jgi:hypothetical protein
MKEKKKNAKMIFSNRDQSWLLIRAL